MKIKNQSGQFMDRIAGSVLSSKSLTAQVADIADKAFTTSGPGLYIIAYYLLTTTAAVGAGGVTLNIKFTDNSSARTISSSAVILTALTGFTQGSIICRLSSGSITYGVTHTGIYSTSAYAIYLSVERLV